MSRTFVSEIAKELRSRGRSADKEDPKASTFYTLLAAELETRAHRYYSSSMMLDEAVAESGYDGETLRRLRRQGRWSGTREDLPRRPGTIPMAKPRAHR